MSLVVLFHHFLHSQNCNTGKNVRQGNENPKKADKKEKRMGSKIHSKNTITYAIDGGMTSLLFSPTRIPKNHAHVSARK